MAITTLGEFWTKYDNGTGWGLGHWNTKGDHKVQRDEVVAAMADYYSTDELLDFMLDDIAGLSDADKKTAEDSLQGELKDRLSAVKITHDKRVTAEAAKAKAESDQKAADEAATAAERARITQRNDCFQLAILGKPLPNPDTSIKTLKLVPPSAPDQRAVYNAMLREFHVDPNATSVRLDRLDKRLADGLRWVAQANGTPDTLDGDEWQRLRVGGVAVSQAKMFGVPPNTLGNSAQPASPYAYDVRARDQLAAATETLRMFTDMDPERTHVLGKCHSSSTSWSSSSSESSGKSASFFLRGKFQSSSESSGGSEAEMDCVQWVESRQKLLKLAAAALADAELALQQIPFYAGGRDASACNPNLSAPSYNVAAVKEACGAAYAALRTLSPSDRKYVFVMMSQIQQSEEGPASATIDDRRSYNRTTYWLYPTARGDEDNKAPGGRMIGAVLPRLMGLAPLL